MYVTEAMIQSMEEMMRNASDMEKSIKMMMETEARMHGLELDSRHNARDMWATLMDHMATAGTQSSMMTEMHMPDPAMDTHAEPAAANEAGLQEQADGTMEWVDAPSDAPVEVTPPEGEAPQQ